MYVRYSSTETDACLINVLVEETEINENGVTDHQAENCKRKCQPSGQGRFPEKEKIFQG